MVVSALVQRRAIQISGFQSRYVGCAGIAMRLRDNSALRSTEVAILNGWLWFHPYGGGAEAARTTISISARGADIYGAPPLTSAWGTPSLPNINSRFSSDSVHIFPWRTPSGAYRRLPAWPRGTARGVATNFWVGGTDWGPQTYLVYLPPKFYFSSGFGHFIMKILGGKFSCD